MFRYYTRACNFYYGNHSIKLVNKKKTLPLCQKKDISFDQIEILTRKSKKRIFINQIKKLSKSLRKKVNFDLKKIKSKKKNFSNLNFKKTNLLGVLNLTPDSFSDGGKFNTKKKAIYHAVNLKKNGADLIDVGGESTRPGSKAISESLEWNRINKVLKLLIKKKIPLSLDTRKSNIMQKGIKQGIRLINDVSGLDFDVNTINVLKKYKVPFVIQHTKGLPENMQKKPSYENVLLDIYDFFESKIKLIRSKGIRHNNIILDPGIGFGKNLKHNMSLIHNISIFHSLGFPILVGNSRKKFIKDLSGINDSKFRVGGTTASAIYLMMQGVQILRIHDVNEVTQGLKIFKKIMNN